MLAVNDVGEPCAKRRRPLVMICPAVWNSW